MSGPTALRVALRYALAHRSITASGDGYFGVGDLVLFGKWKNHHGRILRFLSDKHGNPVIEVEPIPKGRKQNRLIGLYKVWRDPPPDQRGAIVVADSDEHDFDDD